MDKSFKFKIVDRLKGFMLLGAGYRFFLSDRLRLIAKSYY